MARFAVDPTIAAMAQRASQIAAQSRQAQLPSGAMAPLPASAQGRSTLNPTSFVKQGAVPWNQGPNNQALLNALKINPYQAKSRDAIYAAAASKAAAGRDAQLDPSTFSMADFDRGNFGYRDRFGYDWSDEDVLAAAQRYAAPRSYNGVPYTPHNVAAEGDVQMINGVPHVLIKYSTPGFGSSTEWTPMTDM